MAWIKRDENNKITSVLFNGPDYGSGITEEISNDDADLIAFLNREPDVFDIRLADPNYTDEKNETLEDYVRRRTRNIRSGGVSVNGILIPTDQKSLTLISGMAILAQLDPDRIFKFDTGNAGVLEMTANQATMFAMTIANHIQSTFDKRAEILEKIYNNEITTKEEIDGELG